MKYLKMLGLAAVAVMAMMGVAGVGAASADEVCTNTSGACEQINTIEASQVGTGTLETTGGTTLVTCAAGDIHVSVTKQGAGVDPITGTIDTLKFTECSNTVTTLNAGNLDASASGTNGTLSATGSEVTVNGIFGVSCVYGSGAALDIGTTNGTTLTVNAVVPKISGPLVCPPDTRWKASFKITNHSTVDFRNN